MTSRRALVAGLAALAGCADLPGATTRAPNATTDGGHTPTTVRTDAAAGAASPADTDRPTDSGPDTATTGSASGGGTDDGTGNATATGALDLREANVTGVEWAGDPGDDVRFDVTLYHDDDGEDGYANWWQVESPDGDRLGRRELLHAHGTRPFTRSATIAVPADVDCVVVRGHDQTHGYGGQAALVTLTAGPTRLVRQGPDPSSFARVDCP